MNIDAKEYPMQSEAQLLSKASKGVGNMPHNQVRGSISENGSHVEAFAGLEDVATMPDSLYELFVGKPTGVSILLETTNHQEGVRFSMTLSPLPLTEGGALYISNTHGIVHQNELGDSIGDRIDDGGNIISQTAAWVSEVISQHK